MCLWGKTEEWLKPPVAHAAPSLQRGQTPRAGLAGHTHTKRCFKDSGNLKGQNP